MQFYASCPPGLENLLINELAELGALNLKEHPTHIEFEGDLALAYKACLHSRLANRIYLCLLNDRFQTVEELYDKVNRIEWSWHFDIEDTFVVDCSARKSHLIKHSGFGALKVKDAIVDFYQERYEKRPSVNKDNPNYRVHALINGSQIKIGLDLAGRSLHQRGYRDVNGRAPIKENLAAALLIRANWPKLCAEGYQFHDPMCGTGTLLIEAAMMATNMPAGLLRPDFSFISWKQHDNELWMEILSTAKRAYNKNMQNISLSILGSDIHDKSLQLARENIANAGFEDLITLSKQDIRNPKLDIFEKKGLVVTNPPYGERLGNPDDIISTYKDLGSYLKKTCQDWQAAIITTEISYAKAIGVRSHKQYKLKNGSLDCNLYLYDLNSKNHYIPFDPSHVNPLWQETLSDSAVMLKNRLLKNQKRLKSYLKQNNVSCYRLYDADLPEYSAAIDVYEDEVHIQEYVAPKEIPLKVSQKRLLEIIRVTSGILQIPEMHIHIKQRQQQKGLQQYQKQSDAETYKQIQESGIKFSVNLSRYLDTGLFLDHRKTRKVIMQQAKGKRFLNLFAYTGSMSVYAALGGAKVTTVDMSKTYINWANKNFSINNIPIYRHEFIQYDCIKWIQENRGVREYDLIFLDPPTFSNSKRMANNFDVQRDQLELISSTMELLSKDGKLYFSNNYRKFSLDSQLSDLYQVEEITNITLPIDFQRSRNKHRCWLIQNK